MRRFRSKFCAGFKYFCRQLSSQPEDFKPRSVDLDKNLVYGGDLPIATSEKSVGSILFDRLAKKERQDKVLQICASTTKEVTTRVYLQRAVALAERLLESGAKKGDFIALVGNNSVNMNTAMTGIFFVGAVPVPISNKTSLDEFKILMKFMKPKILGCDKQYLYFFRRSLELTQSYEFSKIFLLDEKEGFDENGFEFFKSFIEGRGNVDSFKPADVEDPRQELALVMKALTDGSIGRGVGVTHHNLNSVIARYDVEREDDLSLMTILMVHKVTWMSGIFSLLLNCCSGTKLIIMNEFDENEFLELMEKYKVTTTFLYSSKLWQLYKHEVTRSYDLSSCRYVYALDGTLPQSLIDGMKEKMGLSLRTSYGLSEMTGLVLEPLNSAKKGSVGKLVPQLYGKVISSQTSQRVGPNEAGEICFKGPTLTKGYLNDVKSNRLLFDKEGFLMSGHQGYYDEDGDFFIIDKISYFIKYKEFKISPRELEGVIRSMEVVADVAVGAIQNPSDGFYPIAIVALQKGKKATAYDIIKFVDGKVSNYKRLRGGVIFVSKIPRTRDTGIIRRELIRKILSNYQLKQEIPEMLPEK